MRVVICGSPERAERLQPRLDQDGWEVIRADHEEDLEKLAADGALTDLDAALVLPGDLRHLSGEGVLDRLLDFYERGLLRRARALSVISKAVKSKGGCRFVLVGGHVPPADIPDDQGARASLMAAAGRAAVIDGGPGCTAKVLGPTATDDDIVGSLVPTGQTPMLVWDLSPKELESLSFDDWRLAMLTATSQRR